MAFRCFTLGFEEYILHKGLSHRAFESDQFGQANQTKLIDDFRAALEDMLRRHGHDYIL